MNTLLTSQILHSYSNIDHGTTTRNACLPVDTLDHIVFPIQEHGDHIAWVEGSTIHERMHADGLLTRSKGLHIGVRTADCVPVLLYEPERGIAGVVHAGWRGAVKQIVAHAIFEITRAGGNAARVVASIGPHINPCCFTVNDDVASLFYEMGSYAVSVVDGSKKVHLADVVVHQLVGSGVLQGNIDRSSYCTCCEKDMFVSYRRDGPQSYTNQIVSYIGMS